MNISDLSHYAEVASDAASIIGGAAKKSSNISTTKKTTTADKLISDRLAELLDPEVLKKLKKTKVAVETTTLKDKGASATVQTAIAK